MKNLIVLNKIKYSIFLLLLLYVGKMTHARGVGESYCRINDKHIMTHKMIFNFDLDINLAARRPEIRSLCRLINNKKKSYSNTNLMET